MDNLTLGIIYAVKNSEKSAKESIIDFLPGYTKTPKEYYSDRKFAWIIRNAFIDYLKTADNPAFDVWQYFNTKRQLEDFREVFPAQQRKCAERNNLLDSDTEGIISAFRLSQVRDGDAYVNGFREWKND